MDTSPGHYQVAQDIAAALLRGFDKHYRLFADSSRRAKQRFESGDWGAVQQAVRERIQFYDQRVNETVAQLLGEYRADTLDHNTLQQLKLHYIGLLTNHKQPELAETFFNSVTCKILHRTYFNNDFIFFRPAVSTEYIESDPPTYRSYYPGWESLKECFGRLLVDFGWHCPFENLDRDLDCVMNATERRLGGWPHAEVNLQVQVLQTPFYRNKAAYIIGKIINGYHEYPFAIPVLRADNGSLFLDTILLDAWRIGLLFSLNRAYFMVDMEVPSAYVLFLRSMMPWKSPAELYTMVGLAKQGKNMFFRDLVRHLRHSRDQFIIAPGVRGLVMLVFTLPSFPYVFKVIRDRIAPPKEMDRATVKTKYLLVKWHDRVGRMADSWEFSDVALPRSRCSEELIEELRSTSPTAFEAEGDNIIIRHVYIERRMQPLNIYLDRASPEQVDQAVHDWGNAIRELAMANIFPGDMLWKNFGITRYGRVVFYDYDEIEYLTDCNFRRIPPPPNLELEMSAEAWYSVGKNDIFPEEFAYFLLGNPGIREAFMRHNADLIAPEFWQNTQQSIQSGKIEDFFPYPESIRFGKAFSGTRDEAQESEVERDLFGAPHLSPELLSEVEIE
ncbi:MAG: bifunctional isocitrate dehydrogenase kinase/phosphatase [Betaproteobacteria bacterium]|nr:bifunctional isocitrate dehydrogenase kinase/phosphatase [Betaproteobacteria bacterium]